MPVSLRLPDEVKKRMEKLAKLRETTAHSFMLEAIREKIEADEARAAFHADAKRRLAKTKESGLGVPAAEVFDFLETRARGESAVRPKLRKIL